MSKTHILIHTSYVGLTFDLREWIFGLKVSKCYMVKSNVLLLEIGLGPFLLSVGIPPRTSYNEELIKESIAEFSKILSNSSPKDGDHFMKRFWSKSDYKEVLRRVRQLITEHNGELVNDIVTYIDEKPDYVTYIYSTSDPSISWRLNVSNRHKAIRLSVSKYE